jgi:hypothetical protein
MPQSTIFISYHHDDVIIGHTIAKQLDFLATCGKGRPALNCFLDIRDIPRGKEWKPKIDQNLSDKDWLVVIFTGEQSAYSGYEIGTFSQMHGQTDDKWIMGLYDVEEERLPILLKDGQNTAVDEIDVITDNPDDVEMSANEVNTWYQSPVGRFLYEFCNYRALYVSSDEKNDPSKYSII